MTDAAPHPDSVLGRGLAKLHGEERSFIEMCARAIDRVRICDRWNLSFECYQALKTHFAREISAWPSAPADVVQLGRRDLPPGDRD